MENSAAAWGIAIETPDEEDEEEEFIVFCDAALAFEVFFSVQTQWNHSMDGITGLNYTNVLGVINSLPGFVDPIFLPENFVNFPYGKKLRVKKNKHNLLQEIGAIERGFLSANREKRNKK